MKQEHVITVKRNGTRFTVVLKAADEAKMDFEELMRKLISDDTVTMAVDNEKTNSE